MTPAQVRRTRRTAAGVGAVAVVLVAAACLAIVLADVSFLVSRPGAGSSVLQAGSLALTVPVDGQDIRPGDVVSVRDDDGELVARTVTAAEVQGEQTALDLKGDDEPRVVRTVARVEGSVPVAGYVVTAVASPTGVVLLGALLVVLGLLSPAAPELRGGRHRSRRRLGLAPSSDRPTLH